MNHQFQLVKILPFRRVKNDIIPLSLVAFCDSTKKSNITQLFVDEVGGSSYNYNVMF